MSKLFSLLFQGSVHTSSRKKKVIPLEDFSTLVEASQILEKAKEDVAKYRQDAAEEASQLKEQAKKEGFEEGLSQLNDHILALDQEKKRLRHEMNKLILPLALKAAKKIVAKELETHPETIVDIVMQALSPVMQNKRITIFVNKADRDMLESHKPQLKEKLEHVETLIIADRDDIAPGGCIIETETGIINAAIENQWRALETAFERYVKH
ncbi:MAG: HrpE/YscL family type III secretion apparatus protein [Verrucomicrobia bacterium]|nr:HrpE/YscL family type III secretion apparatus protein [Verrucomicrobiota bacterium]